MKVLACSKFAPPQYPRSSSLAALCGCFSCCVVLRLARDNSDSSKLQHTRAMAKVRCRLVEIRRGIRSSLLLVRVRNAVSAAATTVAQLWTSARKQLCALAPRCMNLCLRTSRIS